MLELLMKNILQASLIGSIGIVFFIIFKKTLFKKYTQAFNYYIWLIIIIEMVIPFQLPIHISKTLISVLEYSPKIIKTEIVFYNKDFINESKFIIGNSSFNNIDIFKTISYLWLIGVIIIVVYNIFTYLNFISKIQHLTQEVSDTNINETYLDTLSELNIKRKISLKFCRCISTPLGTGILNPIILLPITTYGAEEIRWILRHELMHYKRHDILYKIILMAAIVIHWFNPLVYIMWKIINSDCELSCDEAVLKSSNIIERKAYALILVDSMRLNKINNLKGSVSTGFNNNKNILERRLENMFNLKTRKKGVITAIFVVMMVVSSLISVKASSEEALIKSTSTTTAATTTSRSDSTLANGVKTLYTGTASNMPKEFIDSDKVVQQIKENPDAKVVVVTGFVKYTYADAPADVKSQYEADCKSVDKTPSPLDVIVVSSK